MGVDLQFPEDKNHDPEHNALLAFVSADLPNVVHAVTFISDAGPAQPAGLASFRRHGELSRVPGLPVATGVVLPYDELLEQARALAHITVLADRDGTVRRVPLLVVHEDRAYSALGLRLVGVGTGHESPPKASPAGGKTLVGWGPDAEWFIPMDREGGTSLDFAGDRQAFSDTHSMIDILRLYQAGDVAPLRERLDGKYVLVGLDSRMEVTDDVGATPFSATTSLLYIHANVIENLLRNRFLARPEHALYLGALGILGVGLGWLFCAVPLAVAALVCGLALAVLAVADFALLAIAGVDVPPLAALLLPPVTYAGASSARFLFLEARTRRREADIREGRSVEQQFLPEAIIGKSLSRYRIDEKLGRGGMGVVYRARDLRLDRDVALKILSGGALADARARRRFQREALALSKLNHPRIAAVLDFDTQDGIDFLVMEFVRGIPLGARVSRGALPEAEVVRVTEAVAEALAEAHGRGVVHRDLKPDNVMLGERGEVKVLDFGLALFLAKSSGASLRSPALTQDGHMVGTLPYMAPEVLRGLTAEARSDLYSLGVLAFEMATGRRPFPDDEPHELLYTILEQPPAPPRIVNGKISTGLEEIILRLLAKQPSERYGSAAELLDRLASLRAAPSTNSVSAGMP